MAVRAEDVTPGRWADIQVLFDNGDQIRGNIRVGYSVIAGDYESRDGIVLHRLGERWNGRETDNGYPVRGKYPQWHAVPEFLAVPILQGLLTELRTHPNDQAPERNVPTGEEAQARTARVLEEMRHRGIES